jgi:6-phosphogluconolactonase (cycloisomerase 2 family)
MPGGVSLQLSNNGTDAVTISANGSFAFPTPLGSGAGYSVTIASQPAGETCVVTNGAGTVAESNVTTIAISCEQAEFALVPNPNAGVTAVYRVDPTTGALNQVPGSPFPTGGQPSSIAVIPSGNLVAITQGSLNEELTFSIDPSSGALAPVPADNLTGLGILLQSAVANPAVPAVYMLSPTLNEVVFFNVVTQNTEFIPLQAPASTNFVIAPSGKFLYVGDSTGETDAFSLDSVTGLPTAIPGSPFPSVLGRTQTSLSIDPSDHLLYGVSATNDLLIQGTDSSTGGIRNSGLVPGPFTGPFVFVPSGKFAYVIAGNQISTFGISSATDIPSAAGSTTGTSVPAEVTIDPTGRWLYAPSTDGTISAFTINANTGALTPAPTPVPFSSAAVPAAQLVIAEPTP